MVRNKGREVVSARVVLRMLMGGGLRPRARGGGSPYRPRDGHGIHVDGHRRPSGRYRQEMDGRGA